MLGTSPDGLSTLEYVENGVQIYLMGPDLNRADVLEIANSI
jgi:hypothetical protein